MQYNGNEIYATRYMKSLFLFGRRGIGYFRLYLTGTAFSEQLPTAQLHWIIADKDSCIVVESMKDGLHVYDNPVGVLTNNPPFPGQMFALNNYAGVSRKQPESTFAEVLQLDAYSRGMGGMGIPGDLSSQSRFVKVAFTKLNSISGEEIGRAHV